MGKDRLLGFTPVQADSGPKREKDVRGFRIATVSGLTIPLMFIVAGLSPAALLPQVTTTPPYQFSAISVTANRTVFITGTSPPAYQMRHHDAFFSKGISTGTLHTYDNFTLWGDYVKKSGTPRSSQVESRVDLLKVFNLTPLATVNLTFQWTVSFLVEGVSFDDGAPNARGAWGSGSVALTACEGSGANWTSANLRGCGNSQWQRQAIEHLSYPYHTQSNVTYVKTSRGTNLTVTFALNNVTTPGSGAIWVSLGMVSLSTAYIRESAAYPVYPAHFVAAGSYLSGMANLTATLDKITIT
ncbi:MAG: hypothetical protein ACHQ2Y_09890 [Candidatus Lutacidiplasmatales archaeon]